MEQFRPKSWRHWVGIWPLVSKGKERFFSCTRRFMPVVNSLEFAVEINLISFLLIQGFILD